LFFAIVLQDERAEGTMSIVRFIIVAIVFIGLLFLSLANADTVTLRFFNLGQLQAPLIFVVLCAFAIGVALGLAAGVLRTARVKRELKQLRREVREREEFARTTAMRAPTTPPLDAV